MHVGESSEENPVLGFWAFRPAGTWAPGGSESCRKNSLTCLAKCAQAAKAFAEDTVRLFPVPATQPELALVQIF